MVVSPCSIALRVSQSAQRADHAAEQRQRHAFAQQKPAHLFRREAEREQRADLRRALLQAELKQHRHQQQRRDDEEKAEAEKQPAEVLRLLRRLERLFAHRLEAQAEFLRLEIGEDFFLQRGDGRTLIVCLTLALTLTLSPGERGQPLPLLVFLKPSSCRQSSIRSETENDSPSPRGRGPG